MTYSPSECNCLSVSLSSWGKDTCMKVEVTKPKPNTYSFTAKRKERDRLGPLTISVTLEQPNSNDAETLRGTYSIQDDKPASESQELKGHFDKEENVWVLHPDGFSHNETWRLFQNELAGPSSRSFDN